VSNGAKAVLLFLWMPVGALISGWAMMTLWGWFIVPLGVRAIGMAHGWGLAMMVGLYTHHTPDKREPFDIIVSGLITILLVLGFGWIAHSFM
jgi:hypothetical protein